MDVAAANARLIDRMVADGLLRSEGVRLRPTLDGMAIADAIARAFEIPGPPTDSTARA